MNKQAISEKMTAVMARAKEINAGTTCASMMRNPDAEIRAQFKADREIEGSKAWAITLAGNALYGPMLSDDTCDKILDALKGA